MMSNELSVEEETDYFLGPVLGRGVTGYAYEGFRRTDGLDVVIKVLSKKLIKHRSVIERIKEDVACAAFADIRHKNVARNLGVVEIEGRPAVVMQQIPGVPLSQILEEHGPLTDRRALKLILQVVEGLIAAMRNGLHHGDIRPQKLFVDTRGRIWITDFGMAYASCVAARFRKYANLHFGHPEYMAPEVVQNDLEQPNEQSDLYALGITLYELVCGVVPFRGLSAKDTLKGHLRDQIPPPPKGIEVSEGVAELILMLTSKDPDRRVKNLASCLRQVKAKLTGKDPMDVSMSNDNWTQVSASHAVVVQGWDASRIEPTQSQSATNDDDRADEEVMFPQGDFMSGTGFFKPLQSQLNVQDPFMQARQGSVGKRVAHNVKHKIENINISGKDVLFALSVLLNLVLIGVLATRSAPQNNVPTYQYPDNPQGQGDQQQNSGDQNNTNQDNTNQDNGEIKPPTKVSDTPPTYDPTAIDQAIESNLNVLLNADPELKGTDPKVLMVVGDRVWLHFANLPLVTNAADEKAVMERRHLYFRRGMDIVKKNGPASGNISHVDFDALKTRNFDHDYVYLASFREFLLSNPENINIRKRLSLELQSLGSVASTKEQGYYLAVGHGALGNHEECVRWLMFAIENGFQKYDAINADPYLKAARSDPKFREFVSNRGISEILPQ